MKAKTNSLKTVIAEHKNEKVMITLTRNSLIDKPLMYVGGYVKGVWYKKFKKQLIVNFEIYTENKDRFVIFDVDSNFKQWNDYLTNEYTVNSFFKDLLIVEEMPNKQA